MLLKSTPSKIFFAQGKAPLSTPPVALRLTFSAEGIQYVFVDTAKGSNMRRTNIPITTDKYGNVNLEEEDIRRFIYAQLERKDISIHSFELMGGY